MGTHIDGLNHLHDGDRTYARHQLSDIRCLYGTTRLGIETLPQVVTPRTVLGRPLSAVSTD
jgi:hypothetical protein